MDARPEGRWEALGSFLSRDLLLLDPVRKKGWLAEWGEVSTLERSLDDRLAVGLVGGTGVGKSTFINALAGERISLTGERRPTTDRIIAYRHEHTPLNEGIPGDALSEPHVLHANAALERLIVLDFPDFDSVEELHHEILERSLPHLDILLVIVDDMKYGDLRLFELLGRVSQSPENLYVIFNKIDRLELRYKGEAGKVLEEILADLSAKLAAHAGVRIPRDRLFGISAERAFALRGPPRWAAGEGGACARVEAGGHADHGRAEGERTTAGRAGGAGEACSAQEGSVGDFRAIVDLLESYRQEKRRRAAKALNIEARKAALSGAICAEALNADRRQKAERALRILEDRRGELESVLGGIPTAIYRPGERRQVVSAALRGGGVRFGFPLDLLFAMARSLRRVRHGTQEGGTEFSPARIRAHYRAYADGVQNALSEQEVETLGLFPSGRAPPPGVAGDGGGGKAADPSIAPAAVPGGEDLARRIHAALESTPRRLRIRAHALPAIIVLTYVWWLVYPAVEGALKGMLGEGGPGWGEIVRSLFFSLLGGIHPLSLIGLAFCVMLAYAITAFVVWHSHADRVEGAIAEAEEAARGHVRRRGEDLLGGASAHLRGWLKEWSELESLLEA